MAHELVTGKVRRARSRQAGRVARAGTTPHANSEAAVKVAAWQGLDTGSNPTSAHRIRRTVRSAASLGLQAPTTQTLRDRACQRLVLPEGAGL